MEDFFVKMWIKKDFFFGEKEIVMDYLSQMFPSLCELNFKFTKNMSQVHSRSFQFTKNMSQIHELN